MLDLPLKFLRGGLRLTTLVNQSLVHEMGSWTCHGSGLQDFSAWRLESAF